MRAETLLGRPVLWGHIDMIHARSEGTLKGLRCRLRVCIPKRRSTQNRHR